MSLIPNRKGQPLLVEWQVACRQYASSAFALESYDAFIHRAGLKAGSLPNRGQALPLTDLQAALPEAVKAMHAHMVARQATFSTEMRSRLEGTLADLKRLQDKQIEHLDAQLTTLLETVARSRRERRSQQIHRVFDDYRTWVEDTLSTEPQPYIQVLAAVCG